MIRVHRRAAGPGAGATASFVVPWPAEDPALDGLLGTLRAGLRADGLAVVTGGRNGLPVRTLCSSSVEPAPDDTLLAWLARQSRPVIVANVGAEAAPRGSRWLEEEGARSLVAVPFRADGMVAGVLVAFSRAAACFGPACLPVAELAAAVVVPALEALWRAHAAESVLDIAKMAVTRDTIKDLLKEACARAVRLCDGTRACVWVADHQGRSVTSFSATATGAPDPGLWERFRAVWPAGRTLADDAVSRWIVAERTTLVLDDYAESPFCDPTVRDAFGVRSLIALPLLHDARVVGVMTVDRTEVRPFSAAEVRLAVSLAEALAPLVERARVRDETEAELRQAEAQVEIARSLGSTLELKPLLRVIAQQAARACGMDRCSVFLYRGDRLVPAMSQYADGHTDRTLWEMFRTRASGWAESVPVVEEAARTRAPVIVNDTQTDPRVPPAVRQFRGRRMLALPLMRSDTMVGVLGLEYVDEDRPIRPAQVHLGTTIGTQIALALENARLLGEAHAAADALRAKNAELDSFVYTVSHDLKAPLVTIKGMAALVGEQAVGLDDASRRYVRRIELNIRHMEQMLGDLLALAQIGREGRVREEVELAEVVARVLAEQAEPIGARGIAVTVGALPRVAAVRVEIEQVMRNLITNAVKYLGPGPSPAIEVGGVDRGDEVECWVRDNGIGIDPAYQAKIFDLFHRLREVDAEGTGVGLAIVKKIVDAAGGRLWVESARGAGSTFRFTWPQPGRAGAGARLTRGGPGPSSPRR
jgi:signal transduction histidine kinase